MIAGVSRIRSMEGCLELVAGVAVDAGGRAAPIGRSLGARRERSDQAVLQLGLRKSQANRAAAQASPMSKLPRMVGGIPRPCPVAAACWPSIPILICRERA